MSKISDSDIKRLIQNPAEFRQHVLAFPMSESYREGWSINAKGPGFKKRQARMKELVALLLSRDKYGRLKEDEPSPEKIDKYCDRLIQVGLDHFKKRPTASQISVLAPCMTRAGKIMPRWFMFFNESLFKSLSNKSGFSIINVDWMNDPSALLEAVGAMGTKGNPVELLRKQVAAQLNIELHTQSDGLVEDELGDLIENEENPHATAAARMRSSLLDSFRGNSDDD